MEEGLEKEPELISFSLVDLDEVKFKVSMNPGDIPLELHSALQEFLPTSHHANYYIHRNGVKLNDYTSLGEQGITEGDVLRMQLDIYEEKGIRLASWRLKRALKCIPANTSQIISREHNKVIGLDQNVGTYNVNFEVDFDFDVNTLNDTPTRLNPFKPDTEECISTPTCLKGLKILSRQNKIMRMKGKILDIEFVSLEDVTHLITAQVNGFVCGDKQSITLVGILRLLSPQFESNFYELMNNSYDSLQFCPHITERPSWIYAEAVEEEPDEAQVLRDWNEEFQIIRSMPADRPEIKFQKERTLSVIYNDFLKEAKKGAISIIEGQINPLNPMDAVKHQVFVYNNIFFSYAEDIGYKQDTTSEACATYVSVSHDLHALKLLNKLDLHGIHTIASVIVDYRGFRILCQTIIPGILSQNPEKSTKYGSIDDGKTIRADPEFHEALEKVYAQIGIDSSELFDIEGVSHFIHGPYDAKGIIGTDQRKYILEVMRIYPRDANYPGEDHVTALVRPEILEINYNIKSEEYFKTEIADQIKEEDKEQITMEKLNELAKGFKRPIFNPNVFTFAKFVKEDLTEVEAPIHQLAALIRDKQIPEILTHLKNEDIFRKFAEVKELLHVFGINLRYLGEIARQVENEGVRVILERDGIARSAKRIVNRYMRGTSNMHISIVLAHILNCILDLLPAEESKDAPKRKRKQKKRKVATKVSNLLPIDTPDVLSKGKTALWAEVKEEAMERFGLEIPDSFKEWKGYAVMPLLRAICRYTGIQLTDIAVPEPITSANIANLVPILKTLDQRNTESKVTSDNAIRLFKEQNFDKSIECFHQAIQLQSQISSPFYKEVAECYGHLSNIYFQKTNLNMAITYQQKSIEILEKIYGIDHVVVAQNYIQFAYMYQAIGYCKRGINLLIRALNIYKLNYGDYNKTTISLLASICILFKEYKMIQPSLVWLKHYMECAVAYFGPRAVETADACEIYGLHLKLSGDPQTGKEHMTTACEIFEELLGAQHYKTVSAKAQLQSIDTPSEDYRAPVTQKGGENARNAFLKQKLQMRKAEARMPRNQRQMQYPRDEEQYRNVVEELKKKNHGNN